MEEFAVRRLKILLLISSLTCLVFLLLAAFEENITAGWRAPQFEYARRQREKARAAGSDAKSSAAYPIELRQVYLKDWNHVDRCVSCHVGIDNPAFRDAPQPLTSHPGNLLEHHAVDSFGCTICHQGQGRATDKDAAHGRVPFWDQPLLVGDLVQATCTKCHHGGNAPQAPVLVRGQHLLSELGCAGCHQLGPEIAAERVGPPLSRTGSKVSRKWLDFWLANPRSYLPKAKMPRYDLNREAILALSAYLMTFRDSSIDVSPVTPGDHDAGNAIYRESQCIVCHITKEDSQGKPVGGDIGPDLRKIGNKVNQRWLLAFLKSSHGFLQPNTKMPDYRFTDKQAADLAQFIMEEWVDPDLQDEQAKVPEPPSDTPDRIRQGKLLFKELGCAGCHELGTDDVRLAGPDLSVIGSSPIHQLDFGNAKIRHTLPDFLYTKLKSPKAFRRAFELPTWQEPAVAIWQNLRPAALFSSSASLPKDAESVQLQWILAKVQQAGVLDAASQMPAGSLHYQAVWLASHLNDVGALSPQKMPDFQLSDEDAEAATIALMSQSEVRMPSKRFDVPAEHKLAFNPQDGFGVLERRYRCLSCHSIRGSGDRQASDLTYEGSRVNRQWLNHYLNTPYSMRRTLTIAMPNFHFGESETQFLTEYMSLVLVDTQFGEDWLRERDRADAERGKAAFDARGCIACHQVRGKGGDVGPSMTTQVPDFPVGTWVGDKLQGGWIYKWLRNPQALMADTLEPNLGLSDQEALDLTAYLLTLKNPDFQKQK